MQTSFIMKRVLSCRKSLADGLKTAGIPVVIANWKEENGKGIDDLLASGEHLNTAFIKRIQ